MSRISACVGVPPDLWDDVVQETWLGAIKHAKKQSGEHTNAELISLLKHIGRSRAVDARRYLNNHLAESLDALRSTLMDRKSAERATTTEEREWLKALLQELRCRIGEWDYRLLCARIMDRRKHKDLAKETGLSDKAIRKRVSRALTELRLLYFRRAAAP